MSDWINCAHYLNDLAVLPEPLRSRLKLNQLKFNEFANGLRDGIILCNLLNALAPGSIDTSQIVLRRAQTSQLMCLKNINLFLLTCKSKFNLNQQDLFEAHMLYNLDIECVIKALSTLSKTKIAENASGRSGFSITEPLDDSSINDIYYDVQQPLMTTFGSGAGTAAFLIENEEESYYTPDSFIISDATNEQQENIYQAIINKAPVGGTQGLSKNITKKDHVIREIYDSESRFVNTLTIIVVDFLKPLYSQLSEKDRQCIFINIEVLKELHNTLFNKLRDACSGGHGRTSRICLVFDSFKQSMMREYVDYFAGMQNAIAKVDSLLAKDNEFKQRLDDLRKQSDMGNFKLSDLIRVPYQRVLKYHLLFNELNKQLDADHLAKKDVQQTLSSMNELANYLNESQRHKDILDQIDKLMAHLNDFGSQQLKDYGHFIKDDSVRIKSNEDRAAKTRTLLLFDKAIFICKSKGTNYYYKETILINDLKVDSTGGLNHNSTTASNNDSVSSISLTGIHNQYFLTLTNAVDKSRVFNLYFKNNKQKTEWKDSILNAIDKIQPNGYNSNNHLFILCNYERDIVQCSFCKKILYGVFYQGYKCDKCSLIAHKQCISKCCPCTAQVSSNFNSKQNQSAQNHRPQRFVSVKNVQYKVKALYSYNGRPTPPFGTEQTCATLKFNVNDVIMVTDDDDDEWWKGFKFGSASSTEGYFPKSYVCADAVDESTSQYSIKKYPWYANVDREKADLILNRIPVQSSQAIFLVRPRQEGDYAISIKFEKVEHIKIHSLKNAGLTTSVCLVEQKQFSSVIDLVLFYMEHTLEENFPQLRTNLGTPFRELLPASISAAIVIHDYDPKRTSTGVELELKKGERIWVICKEAMGWWRVFNGDGLIGYAPGNYLTEINS